MEMRGVPSCCPAVSGLLLSTALSGSSGKLLHNAFVLPREPVTRDQQEILLRNNSDHAVHIPSDQEGADGSDEDSQQARERSAAKAAGAFACLRNFRIPGVACIGRFGQRSAQCMACNPLLAKRIIVMVVLALIITVLSILTWYFATTHAARSVSTVADALRGDLLVRTEITATTLLRNVNVSSTGLARLLGSPLVPGNYSAFATLEQQVRPILYSAFSVVPQRSLVSFYGKTGLFMSYSSESGGLSILFANSSYLTPEFNSSGTEVPWTKGENMSVTRPWYNSYRQGVDESTGLPVGSALTVPPIQYWALDFFNKTWSGRAGDSWGLLSSRSNDIFILSVAAVKRTADSDPVGVAGVGFSVSEIGRALNGIDLRGGDAYVTTAEGGLLVQTRVAVHSGTGSEGTPLLSRAPFSNNSVVAGAARHLASSPGSNMTDQYQNTNVKIDGRRYILNRAPVQFSGTTLVFVVVIPHDSLWGSSNKLDTTVFATLLSLTVGLALVGCFFIVLLTKGVSYERHLREALVKQAEATNRAENKSNHKSIMFASMSHDLRTPLAAILGLIDLCLFDAAEPSELYSNLSQMKSCATNLLDILNSILDMSKIEAGKLELEESEFDLLEVLEEAVEMFAVVGMMKDLEVVLDLPDDSIEKCRKVLGDPGRVKQVLSNLLSNGVKFTSSGHVVLRAWRKVRAMPRVGSDRRRSKALFGFFSACWPCFLLGPAQSLTRQIVSEDGTTSVDNVEFEFEVDDTGKGIPRDRRRAVFENFVQVDSSVPRTHGGTGLGLGIVRSLVRVMGGEINIIEKDDPREPGTRFRFNLHLQVPPERPTTENGNVVESDTEARDRTGTPAEISRQRSGTSRAATAPEGTMSAGNSGVLQRSGDLSYRRVEGVHVLLAMQGAAGLKATRQWMERHDLQVWTVTHHAEFLPTLEKMKFEVFYEESFRWSECFDFSPANAAATLERWSSGNSSQPGDVELGDNPSGSRGHDRGGRLEERVRPRMLLVIDAAMVSGVLERLIVSLNNSLMQGDLSLLTKVVWLVTPNTPSGVLHTLKHGSLPCDLMLYKPLNVSRLGKLWETVQLLVQNREPGISAGRPSTSFSVSYVGVPLSDSQGPVPPPTPTHGTGGPSELASQGPPSGEMLRSGRTDRDGSGRTDRDDSGREQNAGADSFTTAASSGPEPSLDSPNLEVQPLVQTGSSSSPEVGPVPRIQRSRGLEVMGAPNSLKGMHILVAEDNSVLQRLTKTTLLRLGASVECVDNGQEAAQLVLANLPRKGSSGRSFGSFRRGRSRSSSREHSDEENPPPLKKRPFDMVLMDCQMPVLDGYGATQRIREQEKLLGWRTPVIALTAHAMAKDESKCIDAGMDFYLTKPLATKALLTVVAKINATAWERPT